MYSYARFLTLNWLDLWLLSFLSVRCLRILWVRAMKCSLNFPFTRSSAEIVVYLRPLNNLIDLFCFASRVEMSESRLICLRRFWLYFFEFYTPTHMHTERYTFRICLNLMTTSWMGRIRIICLTTKFNRKEKHGNWHEIELKFSIETWNLKLEHILLSK